MASIESGITGIRKAFDTTPSNTDLPIPCAINLPFEGEISGAEGPYELMGLRQTIHRIRVQVLCGVQDDLQTAETTARPFLKRFVGTFDRYKTLNGTSGIADVQVERYKYGFIKLREGDPGYLGWDFIVRVTEVEDGVVYGVSGPAL